MSVEEAEYFNEQDVLIQFEQQPSSSRSAFSGVSGEIAGAVAVAPSSDSSAIESTRGGFEVESSALVVNPSRRRSGFDLDTAAILAALSYRLDSKEDNLESDSDAAAARALARSIEASLVASQLAPSRRRHHRRHRRISFVDDSHGLCHALIILAYLMEFCLSTVILCFSWQESSGLMLNVAVLIFTARLLYVVPIQWHLLKSASSGTSPNQTIVRFKTYIDSSNLNIALFLIIMLIVHLSSEPLDLIATYCCILIPYCTIIAAFEFYVRRNYSFGSQRHRHRRHRPDLSAIPVRKFQLGPDDKALEIPSCAICLSEFEEKQKIRTLPCKHEFHKSCVDKWFKKDSRCPLCRHDVTVPV